MVTYNFFSSLRSRLFKMFNRKLSAFIFPKKRAIAKTLGFTLIEILVVVAMVGILSAIAAPSYSGFVNNQRLSASQTKVFQALKSTQSSAKSRQSDNIRSSVTFTTGITSGAYRLDNVKIDSGKSQSLEQGTIISSLTSPTASPSNLGSTYSIEFDSRGFVYDPSQFVAGQTLTLPICINLAAANNLNKTKWIKIQTLLGAITTGADSTCSG